MDEAAAWTPCIHKGLVLVLATWCLLPDTVPGKQWIMAPKLGFLASKWELGWKCWLLAIDWPNLSCSGNMRSELADGKFSSHFLCYSAFQIYEYMFKRKKKTKKNHLPLYLKLNITTFCPWSSFQLLNFPPIGNFLPLISNSFSILHANLKVWPLTSLFSLILNGIPRFMQGLGGDGSKKQSQLHFQVQKSLPSALIL